jgi:ankyrin repeat protein
MSKEKSEEQNKVKIGVRDKEGWAPIHYWSSFGMEILVANCVNKGADVNMPIKSSDELNGYTSVILATQRGHVETLLLLARLGAKLDIKDASGMSAILYAMQHKTKAVKLMKTLVGMGADVSYLKGVIEKWGYNILTKLGVDSELTKDFGKMLSDIDTVKLKYASKHDVSKILIISKESKVDYDISEAFKNCDIDTMIKFVTDSLIPESDKFIPNLFVGAAMQATPKYTQMMIAMIKAGCDISKADKNKDTAYKLLMGFNKINGTALSLLGANADISSEINKIGQDGLNDIHRAIKLGNLQTLGILLSSGGNPNLATKGGKLPLVLAMESKYNMSEMLYILIKNGAKIKGFDLKYVQKLVDNNEIDPDSVKLLKKSKNNELEDYKMDELMRLLDKSFWQKIILLDQDQISGVIEKFQLGKEIDIDKMVAKSSVFKEVLSIFSKMDLVDLITKFKATEKEDNQVLELIGNSCDKDPCLDN